MTSERWTGRWDKKLDSTTSLIEMGARPYDPALGRFLAVDPIEGGSLNNYDFAEQDPINSYDLDGKSPLRVCIFGMGSACSWQLTKELGQAGKFALRHSDLILGGAAVLCVGLTAGGCTPLAIAAFSASAGVSAHRNFSGGKRNWQSFSVDLTVSIVTGGSGRVVARAFAPRYMRDLGDRKIAHTALQYLLMSVEQMSQLARRPR